MKTKAPCCRLREILDLLESAAPDLSGLEFARARATLERAADLVQRTGLDACDRMILGKVLSRLREKVDPGEAGVLILLDLLESNTAKSPNSAQNNAAQMETPLLAT